MYCKLPGMSQAPASLYCVNELDLLTLSFTPLPKERDKSAHLIETCFHMKQSNM